MKFNNTVILILFFSAFATMAQKTKDSIPLKSIYFYSPVIPAPRIHNLSITHLDFVLPNLSDIENGMFTIPFNDIEKKPTQFIYDSYKKAYRNKVVKSTFFNDKNLERLVLPKN